jgi:hypothetical protein
MMCMYKVSAICRCTATQQAWSTPMRRREVGILAVAAIFAFATLPAAAQQKSLKEQVVGTWNIVSVEEVYPDGHKETPWGPNMKGAVSFDQNGKVLLMIIGADLPTPSGKPQEAARMVVAYFGTYSVDEGAKTITYTAERATIPAFDGLARKATVTVTGDELRQSSAPVTGPQGTFTPQLVMRRAK